MPADGTVSLKELGLRAESLECPAGGHHDVAMGEVSNAAARGGGTVTCLKCGQPVRLVPR